MSRFMIRCYRRLCASDGASAVEYAILAGFIAAVIVVAVAFLGQASKGNYDCTEASIDAGSNQC